MLWRHFKLLLAANFALTLILLFQLSGNARLAPALFLAFVVKSVGYGASILFEQWLYAPKREVYFKHAGFSYRQLFGCMFALDIALFIIGILLWKTIMAYI